MHELPVKSSGAPDAAARLATVPVPLVSEEAGVVELAPWLPLLSPAMKVGEVEDDPTVVAEIGALPSCDDVLAVVSVPVAPPVVPVLAGAVPVSVVVPLAAAVVVPVVLVSPLVVVGVLAAVVVVPVLSVVSVVTVLALPPGVRLLSAGSVVSVVLSLTVAGPDDTVDQP